MLLISPSAETGGILFGAALLLCALLVFTIREIDIKTRARITPPQKENAKTTENDKEYYIVKKKSPAKKKTKQTV